MLLQSLCERLRCAHLAVYSPSLFFDEIRSLTGDADHVFVTGVIREVLWPRMNRMVTPRTCNRVRLGTHEPLLPFRLILAPLVTHDGVAGLVVGFRPRREPPFDGTDVQQLTAELSPLKRLLSARVEAHTGLLHRRAFEMEAARRSTRFGSGCVIYADVDQVHAINDLFGFETGDTVIREIGRMIHSSVQRVDGIATHFSGDRYVMMLFGQTLNQASSWAEEVRLAVEQMESHDALARATLSLGVVAVCGELELHHTVAAAETACRVAKDRGRNRLEIYEPGNDGTVVRRHAEVHGARTILEALEGNQCVLHGQSIVSLQDRTAPNHYEILLRIRDAEGALSSIGAHLQAAARYQILERMDRWVIRRVLEALAPKVRVLMERGVCFAVNITGQSLSQPAFADFARTELKRTGIPAGLLEFEFTETAAVVNLEATRRFIGRLSGYRIALDDFGTGMSSLALIKDLSVQRIKIDGRFVRDVLVNPCSQALIEGLAQIAKRLGIETVAEFVETAQIEDHLRFLGVTHAQGYLYGPVRALSDILEELSVAQRQEGISGTGS